MKRFAFLSAMKWARANRDLGLNDPMETGGVADCSNPLAIRLYQQWIKLESGLRVGNAFARKRFKFDREFSAYLWASYFVRLGSSRVSGLQ